MSRKQPLPKYQKIYDDLVKAIQSGRYKAGQKFPSEAALVQRYGASRITVGRALRELQLNGFIDRVAGSGTWVRDSRADREGSQLFGLVIPNLGETEIFEPICQGIAGSPDAAGHALLWGNSAVPVMDLCRQYIERAVSGVFFAPLELAPDTDAVNGRVLRAFEEAGIPVVLLDRRPDTTVARRRCDLVGIDNHRAGFVATEHLIRQGARRIGFVSLEHQASTVSLRRAGFRDALAAHRMKPAGEWTLPWPHEGALPVKASPPAFDAIVCANDRVAGMMMHALLDRGIRIPEDVRIVGMDDVNYASLLPVPLTTIHQPCRDIGETALRVLLDRIARPQMTARNILLDCYLVVRRSCGASATPESP